MFEDLKKEMHYFLEDICKNIENEKDLKYVMNRTSKLYDAILDEMDKIVEYKSEKLNNIIKKQEEGEEKIQELKEKIEELYEDMYEEEEDFIIDCPYCNNKFEAEINEFCDDIICPECGNIIELDWTGNVEDDPPFGCGENCSGCNGCGN